MRIGIDARSMFAAGLGRGPSTYARKIVFALLDVDDENDYCLFVARNQPIDELIPRVKANGHARIVRLSRPTRAIFVWDQCLWYWALKRERIEVFHSLMYGVPYICGCTRVLTIHDLTPLVVPEVVHKFRHRFVFRFNFRTARSADRIIVPSLNTGNDVMRILQIQKDRIVMIGEGAFDDWCESPGIPEITKVLERHRIHGRYLLYVGGFDPHKNLQRVLEAFRIVKAEESAIGRNDLYCVFVGKVTENARKLAAAAKDMGLADRVVFTDFVPEEEMRALYRGAEVFVFPSLYEGLGLAPLEAMGCGAPVVAANASSLPELIGDAGILVDPGSTTELARAISRVLNDSELREGMRAKGLIRSKQFSWTDAARRTVDAYRDAVNDGNRR